MCLSVVPLWALEARAPPPPSPGNLPDVPSGTPVFLFPSLEFVSVKGLGTPTFLVLNPLDTSLLLSQIRNLQARLSFLWLHKN